METSSNDNREQHEIQVLQDLLRYRLQAHFAGTLSRSKQRAVNAKSYTEAKPVELYKLLSQPQPLEIQRWISRVLVVSIMQLIGLSLYCEHCPYRLGEITMFGNVGWLFIPCIIVYLFISTFDPGFVEIRYNGAVDTVDQSEQASSGFVFSTKMSHPYLDTDDEYMEDEYSNSKSACTFVLPRLLDSVDVVVVQNENLLDHYFSSTMNTFSHESLDLLHSTFTALHSVSTETVSINHLLYNGPLSSCQSFESTCMHILHTNFCVFCLHTNTYADTHHCTVCNRCVYSYDHHCPIQGTCIGVRNHAYFVFTMFMFAIGLTYAILLNLYSVPSLPCTRQIVSKLYLPCTPQTHDESWTQVLFIIRYAFIFILLLALMVTMTLGAVHVLFICTSTTSLRETKKRDRRNNPQDYSSDINIPHIQDTLVDIDKRTKLIQHEELIIDLQNKPSCLGTWYKTVFRKIPSVTADYSVSKFLATHSVHTSH